MASSNHNVTTKYDTLHGAAASCHHPEGVEEEAKPSTMINMIPPDYSKPQLATAESAANPMVLQVVAPSSLREGYELQVNVGGEYFTVIVPPGGVEAGQTIMAEVVPRSRLNNHRISATPVGAWKDDLCDCCVYGCCHPVLWLACCCPPVLLAQIMYRLQLDGCGWPTSRQQAEDTFFIVVGIFAGFLVSLFVVLPLLVMVAPEGAEGAIGLLVLLLCVGVSVLEIYWMVLFIRTRRFIRNKYAIPALCCGDLEDCCCGCFKYCKCCALAQMARHTADYDTYPASCCSKSGLAPHIPEIV